MRKSDPQRVENFVRSARKQLENPDLPDDLRAMYQRISDKGEAREILINAQALALARMRAEGQAEPQDTAQGHAPSKPTKGTR